MLPLAAVLSLVAFATGCSESYGHRVVRADENQLTIVDANGIAQKTHEVAADASITIDGQPAVLQELDPGDPVHVKVELQDGKEVATEIKAKTKEPESPEATSPATDPTLPNEQPLQPTEDEPVPYPNDETAPQETPSSTETTFPDLTPDVKQSNQPDAEPQAEPAEDQAVQGKIKSIGEDGSQLVVTSEDGEEHTVMVNDETKFMLDGETADFEDMKVDHQVAITAEKDAETLVATLVEATSK